LSCPFWPFLSYSHDSILPFRFLRQSPAKRTEREALVEVRFTTVTLNPPARPAGSPKLKPLTIGVVEVIEAQPPANEPAVHWLLVTTLPLNTVDDALTVIR